MSSLVCALGLSRAVASEPLTPADFTEDFASKLRAASTNAQVKITQDLQLSFKDNNGKENTVFLDNAYAEYKLNPANKSEVIEKYVRAFLESNIEEGKIDKSRIVPIIKDRAWINEVREALKSRGAKEVKENVFDDYNEDLVIMYAEDSPKNIRYLTPDDLKTLGIKKEELRGLAVTNLKALLPKIEIHSGPFVSMVVADGNYEASLLLFDKMWTSGQIKVDGDFVVAIPSRDLLLVTGSNNPQGIAQLREMVAKNFKDSPYRLTDALFVFRDGKFQRLSQN
jgi:uncharacterized protein YtpQ (UPF0354 family)